MTKRPLAVFDVDGTLFRWQLYYAIVLELHDQGLFSSDDSAAIKKTYAAWQSRTASFSDFEHVAIDSLTRLLPTLPTDTFDTVVKDVMKSSAHKTHAYTRKLAEELKRQGYFLLAVSGSPQEIADPFVRKYGFDDCIGWIYERIGESFTGEILRNTVHDKAALIRDYASQHGFSLNGSVGIGDSKGDIAMLRIVERPIAFNPSEELLDEALKHGWDIVIERKNIAYTLKKGQDGAPVLAQTDRF